MEERPRQGYREHYMEQPYNGTKSTYDPQQHAKQQEQQASSQFMQRKSAISQLEETLDKMDSIAITGIMDAIESILHACGGEAKATFMEVTSDLIRVQTRVPLQANLYPFLPEQHIANCRFHRKVTELVLKVPTIHGVRWISAQDGSQMVVSIK